MPVWVTDETKWEKAKKQAEKQGRSGDYAYITGIYKKMGGQVKISKKAEDNLRDLLKARPTKYIRRVAKPGGGYKYYYTKKGVQTGKNESKPTEVKDFKPITEPKEMKVSAMGLEQRVKVSPVDLNVGFDYNFGVARMKYPSGRKAWAIIDMDSGLTISSGNTGESLKRVTEHSALQIKKHFKSREAMLEKVQEAITKKEQAKKKSEQLAKEKAERDADKKKKEVEAVQEAIRIEQKGAEDEARRKGNAQEKYDQALKDIEEARESFGLKEDDNYDDFVDEYFGYDPLIDEDATAEDIKEAGVIKNALGAVQRLPQLKEAAQKEAGQLKLFARPAMILNNGMPLLKGKLEETSHKTPPKEYREEGAEEKVDYADPKNYKYPLHKEENVRAALSYFAKPKNHNMYSPEERKSIARRIVSAAGKYKIEVSDDWKKKFGLNKAEDKLRDLIKSRQRPFNKQDGSGKGKGMPDGKRKNKNEDDCQDDEKKGPGKGQGGGRGEGKGRIKKAIEPWQLNLLKADLER